MKYNIVLEQFPKIELSYESIVHKKVPSTCVSLIPDGEPCFAWFTTYNEHNVCFIINASMNSVKLVNASFDASLCICAGTILQGVSFYQKDASTDTSVNLFAIEDVLYYKGDQLSGAKCSTVKLGLMLKMLKTELGKHAFTSKCVVFGLPIMHSDFDELIKIAQTQTCYRVKYVQFATIDKCGTSVAPFDECFNECFKDVVVVKPAVVVVKPSVVVVKPATIVKTFKVVPDIQPDIYHLFKNEVAYGIAYIPNYTVSAMMNKLFRNFKENDNLDALEESDDEEEFENDDPHKFVHLDRSFNMSCSYHDKFKKWVPVKVVPN